MYRIAYPSRPPSYLELPTHFPVSFSLFLENVHSEDLDKVEGRFEFKCRRKRLIHSQNTEFILVESQAEKI